MKKRLLMAFAALVGLALMAFLLLAVRQARAGREIEREAQSPLPPAPALAETSRLEILPLYEEASASDELISGHGVSYLVRTDSGTILLDVGFNPDAPSAAPFAQNMQALGIAWDEVDMIAITHPHPDHLGGTEAWRQGTVSLGADAPALGARPVYVPARLDVPGAVVLDGPTLLQADVATTGVISYPEVFPLSVFEPKGVEQALVVHVAGEGLVLITGCGHPTLERLVERAEALYGVPIVGVVGGLHYEGASAQDVEPHIQFLQARHAHLIALSPHDSSPEALSAFEAAFGDAYHLLRVGESIQFPARRASN